MKWDSSTHRGLKSDRKRRTSATRQGLPAWEKNVTGYATLREAVFARDDYTRSCCGKNSFKDTRILRGPSPWVPYRRQDKPACQFCQRHVQSATHRRTISRKGSCITWKPELKDFKGATFMTMVRWDMLDKLKVVSKDIQVDVTYGAATKEARRDLKIKKSHANDAYCMGSFHPSHRTDLKRYEKCRRNNRVLSKFYDATYIDILDGKRRKRMPLGATVPKGVNLAGVKRTNASIVAKRCRKAGSYCVQREQSSVQVIR